jgi:outer membrane protein assembly factor BamB
MRTLLPLLALALPADAQDWPHWRGQHFDGSAEADGLPETFDKQENVLWAAALPGLGASTPIIVGEHIFLTAIVGNDLVGLCLDRVSGEVRWSKALGSGYQAGGAGSTTVLHPRSNYASPSAVSDGARVVFFFGNGDLVCTDLDGEELWRRNLQKDYGDFCFQWTFSSSPTLWDGVVHMQILQRDSKVRDVGNDEAGSFLVAFKLEDGEEVYRAARASKAVVESLESYATPIPYIGRGGRPELIIMGGDVITGHDPGDGTELWRWGTWNPDHREQWWRVVPSPVVGGGVALACGPKGAPVCAVKLGGEGVLGDSGLAWASEGRRSPLTTDVPTPLFYRGDFYVLSDLRSTLSRVHPSTGEVVWTVELPSDVGRWRASPTGADGRIWLISHGGVVMVFDAESGALAHRVPMGEEDDDFIRASIAVAHGAVFVRTNTTLFCLEEAAEK